MVLGPDGTVQNQDSGFNPRLAADLPVTIEALLAGKSTADDAKNRYKQLVEEYNRAIQEPPAPTSVVPLPQAKIAPHDEPKSLQLTRRWNCGELKAPGNILVVEDPRDAKAEPKLLVLDGPRTVVELSRDGKILARHELAIPQQAVVTFLRTAVDGAGHRYFAGSASGQQQLFLFDADWKLLLDFPKADQGAACRNRRRAIGRSRGQWQADARCRILASWSACKTFRWMASGFGPIARWRTCCGWPSVPPTPKDIAGSSARTAAARSCR